VARDLRGRLRRIKEIRNRNQGGPETPDEGAKKNPAEAGPEYPRRGQKTAGTAGKKPRPPASGPALGPEWSSAGLLSVKRTLPLEPSAEPPAVLPGALPILIPDLIPYSRDWGPPDIFDLLFFDLETTGLSGGAGTVAFLAALGRFVREKGPPPAALRLRVTQYLLLDYPGEGDFLEAALAGLERPAPSGRPPLVVTYNGKTFDSQILKIRCLMNGLTPPVYYHADLLHPARRLWKRVLPACSQGEIETAILGLDRSGDIPGALAPDMWFSFLNTGETVGLLKICDHNLKDIAGLAALFAALARIAENPAAAPETYRVDLERLALRWFYAQKGGGPRKGKSAAGEGSGPEDRRGEELLVIAADRACPRAAYVWARELIRRGRGEEGIRRLSLILSGEAPGNIKAAAYRTLAIDAEWRLGAPQSALEYVDRFLSPENIHPGIYEDMQKRRERLLRKILSPKKGGHREYQGDDGG
jgi:uncharacterized protein YprB with RNaseH-like and TPR domain